MTPLRRAPLGAASLPYRKPREGRDYWTLDDAVPNAVEIRERCLARTDWMLGFPHRSESWPGMRAQPALLPEELARLEAWVKVRTGAKRLWQERSPDGAMLNHNCVQLVGEDESGPRPHTDSKALCKYAAVLYLSPGVPATCGTSFYRVRMTDGQLGGNVVPAPHHNLVEALGTRFVPPDMFVEDVRVDYRFNRLLAYRGDLIHSARAYWGRRPADRRMAAVFFWMA
jgi:Family of unknown function (DUF6445)